MGETLEFFPSVKTETKNKNNSSSPNAMFERPSKQITNNILLKIDCSVNEGGNMGFLHTNELDINVG